MPEEIYIPGVGYLIDYGSEAAAYAALAAEQAQGVTYQEFGNTYTSYAPISEWRNITVEQIREDSGGPDIGGSWYDPGVPQELGGLPPGITAPANPNTYSPSVMPSGGYTAAPQPYPETPAPVIKASNPLTGINPFDKVPWVGRTAPGGLFSTTPPVGASPPPNLFGNILGGIGDAAMLPLLILSLSGNSRANNWLMLAMLLGTLNDKPGSQGGLFN